MLDRSGNCTDSMYPVVGLKPADEEFCDPSSPSPWTVCSFLQLCVFIVAVKPLEKEKDGWKLNGLTGASAGLDITGIYFSLLHS